MHGHGHAVSCERGLGFALVAGEVSGYFQFHVAISLSPRHFRMSSTRCLSVDKFHSVFKAMSVRCSYEIAERGGNQVSRQDERANSIPTKYYFSSFSSAV